jgi:competence protein ComEA
MFYLTPQERKFVVLIVIVFSLGAFVQLLLRRDIAPVRWAKSVREFKIDINTARTEELQMLPGIGAGLSKKIVDFRNDHGPYKSLEALRGVDGLTAKRFERIKELIKL